MSYIKLAKLESEINGLRIGRTSIIDQLDADKLVDEIFDLKLDVCKIKVKLSNPDVFKNLESLKIPFGIHSILVRNEYKIKNYTGGKNPDFQIEIYDPINSQEKYVEDLIRQIVSEQTAMRYQNDIYKDIFDEKNVVDFITSYFNSYNNSIDLNKFCFLVYFKQQIIGIGVVKVSGHFAEGIDVGILPEFRSNNFFIEMMNSLLYLFQNAEKDSPLSKCEQFNYNTILFNPRSLNTSLKFGFKVTNAILNINVYSLLSSKQGKLLQIESHEDDLIVELDKVIREKVFDKKDGAILSSFNSKRRKHSDEIQEWTFFKCFEKKGQCLFIFYNANHINYGYLDYKLKRT